MPRAGIRRTSLRLAILAGLALMLGACARLQPPSIQGFGGIETHFDETGDLLLSLRLKAHNPNRQTLRLTHADLTVYLDQSELGNLRLDQPIVLPGRADSMVRVPLRIHFRSRGDKLRVAMGLALRGPGSIELEGSVRGRLGILSKTYTVPRRTLPDLLRGLGLNPDQLTL